MGSARCAPGEAQVRPAIPSPLRDEDVAVVVAADEVLQRPRDAAQATGPIADPLLLNRYPAHEFRDANAGDGQVVPQAQCRNSQNKR